MLFYIKKDNEYRNFFDWLSKFFKYELKEKSYVFFLMLGYFV